MKIWIQGELHKLGIKRIEEQSTSMGSIPNEPVLVLTPIFLFAERRICDALVPHRAQINLDV